ncbi:U32 family peptidase [Caulifigura coniformis]|uniref:U32 family peptidase n=1 Tax=Caulifigura coniformis TaxID=2527983 RepID=UPI0011A5DA4D|nr:U32 family peptidase [Caulifigura coniformis]
MPIPVSPPPASRIRRTPELLAPAGDRQCIRAAIENGADAVYFGLNVGFNARARAENMGPADLPEIMAELHQRGVRGYVTLNTLVFSDELDAVEPLIRQISAAGVDAVLVQDIGLARLVRAIAPDLPIHASTQMTMTSAETIRELEGLEIERIVLARELSVKEIGAIASETPIEIEAFVHGALCVAYSGQCLTSESLGGRSANRGQCAQACRLPYELVCDGEDVDLGDVKYLLSPQDLAAYALADDLIDAGVSCFKIEGRLKTPEYVANITRHYRRAIDAAVAGKASPLSGEDVQEMELSFSRGFSPGWLGGCDHKVLVPGLSSAKRGVLLGEIVRLAGERVVVRLQAGIAAGDGVVFEGDRAARDEQGGRILKLERDRHEVHGAATAGVVDLLFHHGAVDVSRLWPGQKLWKTDDPRLNAKLRKTFQTLDPQRRVAVDLDVHAEAGQQLRVSARTATGYRVEVATDGPLEPARRHTLTEAHLREQLGRLGGTNYELQSLHATIIGAPMLPLSVSSILRHEMVRRLDELATAPPARRITAGPVLPALRAALPNRAPDGESSPPILHILGRNLEQLVAAMDSGATHLTADFSDIRHYTDAVRLGRDRNVTVAVATPRIQKPGEMGLFRRMAKDAPAAVLVRNLSGLAFFRELGIPVLADFSLNVTNELTAHWLMEKGARTITASYDMNRDQLLALVQALPPQWLEVVIHQHMPMFHMEHCVFCAVLSPGTNKTNCGRPCDDHVVQLRDRVGMEHPLTADVGCRNTLFNAQAQSGAEAVTGLLQQGVRRFRIEFLEESPSEVRRTIDLYRDLLAGQASATGVWTELKAMNRVGVTRGTLESRRDPLAIL